MHTTTRHVDVPPLADLVRSGQDLTDEVCAVAHAVAGSHARARSGPEVAAGATREALVRRWEDDLRRARAANHPALDVARLDEVGRLARRFLDGRGDLLEDRIQRGAIVEGHGDLNADNVLCLDDRFRYVDRLDDIAFLAMGLDELGAPDAAALLLDVWAEHLGDPAPASLIHHHLAHRALVRAEVSALRGTRQAADVDRYLATALTHLRAGAVQLVLVGGAPGTGKSTLAGAVADRFGMVVLSSDRIGKELEADHSTPGHTRATYAAMLERAERLLRRGESVVLDATWTEAAEREQAGELARRVSADLVELRCELDERMAQRRLVTRHSPSGVGATVATRLREADPWPSSHAIDTGTTLIRATERACALVRPHPAPALVPVRLAAVAS